jgi:sugar-specific transcriptional regulator TrmB
MPSGALEQLGMGRIAERVYTALLSRGPSSIAELARVTGQHRPGIYKILALLLEEGIVSRSPFGKRVVYKAEPPVAILELLKKRVERVQAFLPQYSALLQPEQAKPKVSVLSGRSGVMSAFGRIIAATPKNGTIFRYESLVDPTKANWFYSHAYTARTASGGDVSEYIITHKDIAQKHPKNLNQSIKTIAFTPEAQASNIVLLISGPLVLEIDFDSQSAVVTEHEPFARFHHALFASHFKLASK